ncbi:hypothetical protein B5807_02244 [Epicoccum nigrum]|uniref:MYND-type domain-containing protein n=1 Tax=Epicoccum nigrum TaxID=105696 RepID=A0A1Y2M8N0_EPING|nr:hypothetical protein B5807_02244 [Epicoccum nigrum]
MALKPVHIVQNLYLYPVGNTPAVCFTDSLPPELDANVLLLGCGDVRNILFTVYSGGNSDHRKLDFTCCDIEAEIIARNTVILTPIADDEDAVRVAVPVIFASPISRDEAGLVSAKTTSGRGHRSSPAAHTQATQPQKEGCLKCGVATTKAGNPLLKCPKSKTAQYCSPNCQKKDWKKHKQTCEQA